MPVAQDALWEVFAREHQEFHGLGENPVEFPEIESTYDDEAAKREAARCYRCDAETGSSDYNVRTREDIFVMARTKPEDARKQRAVFTKRLDRLEADALPPEVATLDDIVFLPANLSRLVIDPYRDACRVATELGDAPRARARRSSSPASTRRRRRCARPWRTAVEAQRARLRRAAPARRRRALAAAARRGRRARSGRRGASSDGRRAVRTTGRSSGRRRQLLGLAARRPSCPRRSRSRSSRATTCSCSRRAAPVAGDWPELAGAPDLSVMRDAIRILRELNREEDIELLYFGGVRSGTDAAKLIGLGANAVVVGMSLALAVGGRIEDGTVAFYGDIGRTTGPRRRSSS